MHPDMGRKELNMNSRYSIGVSAAAVVLVLVLASLAMAGGDTPQIKQKEGIGNYLTDGKGITLYYFKNDQKDKNSCAGPCLEKWPIYYGDQITPPRGSDAKEFGEFTRADGKKQSTFKRWPLYYFVGDKAPGDTNGQGVKKVWYVVNPTKVVECD
jgi:predicted lipoprotein with Yx(FWY)xxD motif